MNLAFSLAKSGAKVGIMDSDIYGPSLPTLVNPEDPAVQFRNGRIQPLEAYGVKLMSFGYVNPDSAVMRGPMIANVVNQLLSTSDWGELDYLVLDMPPGTGDIQLTLSQIVNITAAVVVTTPQRLAFVDVVKGMEMFDKVNVPCVAVVENMAWFEAPESGVKHFIFGKGHKTRLMEQYGIRNSFSMPIEPRLSERGDEGVPFVVSEPHAEVSKEFERMADAVVREVAKIQFGGNKVPEVEWKAEERVITVTWQGNVQNVNPAKLRRECRCALCVDEMTGVMLLDPDSIKEDIWPRSMKKVGNYALEVVWSDGHLSLYPYARFVDGYDVTKGRGGDTLNVDGEKTAEAEAETKVETAERILG